MKNKTASVVRVPPLCLLSPVAAKQTFVELRGFEPLASSMPWKRSTN